MQEPGLGEADDVDVTLAGLFLGNCLAAGAGRRGCGRGGGSGEECDADG
jgi:hypothetical protein